MFCTAQLITKPHNTLHYIQNKTHTRFPSLELAKSHTTYNQQKDQNRLWEGGHLIVKMLSVHTSHQLYIFWHDCYMVHMDHAKVGVFQELNQICLCSFLQSHYGMCLEAHFIFSNFEGYLMN